MGCLSGQAEFYSALPRLVRIRQHSFEWNQMTAMSVLGSLPVLLLFLLFQRYFIVGMSAMSIKSLADFRAAE